MIRDAHAIMSDIVHVRCDQLTTTEWLATIAEQKPRWWERRRRASLRALRDAHEEALRLLDRKLTALIDELTRGTAEWNRAMLRAAHERSERRTHLLAQRYQELLNKPESGQTEDIE